MEGSGFSSAMALSKGRWIQFEFDQEGDVVGGQVLAGETDELLGVLLMDWAEDTGNCQ